MRHAVLLGFAVMATSAMAAPPGDWPTFGGDAGGSQYSPLRQITTANVGELKLAWAHRSGDVAGAGSPSGATSLEAIPIHANGMLYYCTPLNRVFALDPATGAPMWMFDMHSASGAKGPRKATICRSVAYWQSTAPRPGTACEKRVFAGDANGNVYAIDAGSGAACPDFGAARGHPGYAAHDDFDARGAEGAVRGSTTGPFVAGDLVISATSARDSMVDANDGFVRAFDVRSGELRWAFSPIPDEHAHRTGAANVWSTMSADPAHSLLFVPTTSPSSDFYGVTRKDLALPLTDSTVALALDTGKPVWNFQATHHDLFDFDLPGHPLLVTIRHGGQQLPVAIQQTKLGRMFVFDRLTGKPVFPIAERPAPRSDIPGEVTAPTQPMPDLPQAWARQKLTEDDLWGITPWDRAWCRDEFRKLRYEGPFTPPSERGSLVFPFGGGNWGGVAFDPANNLVIAKGQNMALRLRLVPRAIAGAKTQDLVGTPYRAELGIFTTPGGVPCTPPPFGTVTAIDMDSGRIRWQVPLGQAKWRGITAPAFLKWGSPNIGGPMVTAGGLVFIAASIDGKLRALDVRNGEELWQHDLAAPGMTIPMTYTAGGRQYVVIAAGGNPRMAPDVSDAIMAFALPMQK